jgi:acetyl esterase/lipase
MQDVAAIMDHILKLASAYPAYPIDTSRVIAAGHSAGGQLDFLLAARHHIPHTSVLAQTQPNLVLKGVVALAGAVDLRLTIDLGSSFFNFTNGGPAVKALMGGTAAQVKDRYSASDPGELLPLGVPQILVQGNEDDQIPPTLPTLWAQAARRQGHPVDVKLVPGADHVDVVDPESRPGPLAVTLS